MNRLKVHISVLNILNIELFGAVENIALCRNQNMEEFHHSIIYSYNFLGWLPPPNQPPSPRQGTAALRWRRPYGLRGGRHWQLKRQLLQQHYYGIWEQR